MGATGVRSGQTIAGNTRKIRSTLPRNIDAQRKNTAGGGTSIGTRTTSTVARTYDDTPKNASFSKRTLQSTIHCLQIVTRVVSCSAAPIHANYMTPTSASTANFYDTMEHLKRNFPKKYHLRPTKSPRKFLRGVTSTSTRHTNDGHIGQHPRHE